MICRNLTMNVNYLVTLVWHKREYSSGENIRKGHITRQGNSRVRAILIEVAWRAIKKDKVLAAFFDRLYPRTGKKRAIVAVARKLIGRIRAAFEHGETYCLGYQAPRVLSSWKTICETRFVPTFRKKWAWYRAKIHREIFAAVTACVVQWVVYQLRFFVGGTAPS